MSTIATPPPLRRATPPALRDDRALLEAVRAGDPMAMGELYVRHRDHIRRYVASLGSAAPDEVVSESFARTLRAIRNGAGPTDHPRRYLFATARSVVIARGVEERRRHVADRAYARHARLSSHTPEASSSGALYEAFAALPARQQTALWMTEVEGRPASEVGEVLGITLAAVYALGLRSRRNLLRAYLEASALEPEAMASHPDRSWSAEVGAVGARPTG